MEGQKKRRGKKLGTVDDARRILWRAIEQAGELVDREGQEPGEVLKVLHAVSQAVASYARVTDVAELEARLKLLEAAEKERAEAEAAESGPRYSLGGQRDGGAA